MRLRFALLSFCILSLFLSQHTVSQEQSPGQKAAGQHATEQEKTDDESVRQATEQTATKQVKDLILDGESFLLNERPAFIMWPVEEKRQTPQPWVMYCPTIPGCPDSHEKWMHEQFINAGIAVAGIDIGEAYGSPEGQKHFSHLYHELTTNKGFAAKPVLLGRSRGGLWASSWAIKNPTKVAGLAGIYPVFDLTTYPGVKRAAPAYAMTEAQLQTSLAELNPIHQVNVLAKARIPVFLIHGKIDKVVPIKQNSEAFVEAYKMTDAASLVELIVVEDQGHNYFEGFFRCQELVDFTIKCAQDGASHEVAND